MAFRRENGAIKTMFIISKNNLIIYTISSGAVGLCCLLYAKISVLSPLSLFHFWNPVQFLQSKEILGTYTNVNFFGYPVSLKISGIVVIVLWLAAFSAACVLFFAKTRNLQYRNFRLHNKVHFSFRVHGKFWHTCYRVLILQKGIYIFLAAAIVSTGVYQTFHRMYNNDDIYYENFCTHYAGSVTSDTRNFLTEKHAHYDEVEAELAGMESSGNGSIYQMNRLYAELNDRTAFEKFAERVETIPESGVIFYDMGYSLFFALDGNHESMTLVLYLTIALVLLLCPTVSLDCKSRMVSVLYATTSGKRGYYRQFFGFAAVGGVILSLPYLMQILQKYGTQGFSEPLSSLTAYANMPDWVSVGSAMAGVLCLRMVGTVLSGMLIVWIASKCKSLVSAYCINAVIFVLPAALYLLGLNVFQWVGLTLVLRGIF